MIGHRNPEPRESRHHGSQKSILANAWLTVVMRYPRLPRDLAWIAAVIIGTQGALVIMVVRYGYDSHAYWLAWRQGMYSRPPNTEDAYLYSPAFAQLIRPFTLLPWPIFATGISLLLLAALIWLLVPLPRRWALPAALAGLTEVTTGNIYLIMAIVVVIGWNRPWSWTFMALTKVTPCLGPVWFIARRDWRRLFQVAVVTALIFVPSWMIEPDLWRAWWEFLRINAAGATGPVGSPISPPLWLRIPAAAALVWWGARRDYSWVMPLAVFIATPVLGLGSLAILAALPRIMQQSKTHGT